MLYLILILVTANLVYSFLTNKNVKKMTTAEQTAFDTLSAKVTTLETGLNSLIALANETSASLKALAAGSPDNSDEINALSAKIDADVANVTTALTADAPAPAEATGTTEAAQ